ncbi:MAG: hypothetical protein M1608_08140, partial [Candidatus Omnitrophica bacterium]|nr:hypothetical protein [Candidatus Omnitrophota bacterium]
MVPWKTPLLAVIGSLFHEEPSVDGLKGADSAASSYLFLGVARPNASDGIVAGWITQERGSGSVHSKANA